MTDQSDRKDAVTNTSAGNDQPEIKKITIRRWGSTTNLQSTPDPTPQVTSALDRDPVMDDGQYRGNMTLANEASVVLQFMPSGLCHVMPLSQPTIVGRMTDVLNLPLLKAQRHGVSREHVKFQRKAQHLVIVDLGSTNGTFVNGQRLNAHQEYELADGDELAFGTLHLTLHFSLKEK